ncbi:MAG: isoprenyl transferase [Flavobacteriales bacterium]
MSLLEKINKNTVPKHVAIIMDGNGRWAKKKGMMRVFGHQNGVKAVRAALEASVKSGVQNLTLYAFSTENWNRPQAEINALMELLVDTINGETKTLNENSIRLHTIGNIQSLPEKCQNKLQEAINNTKHNTKLNLILALSYSSKWEITNAVKNMCADVASGKLKQNEIEEKTISAYLNTAPFPDPELMIRTSGEYRISNFLLWQLAYSELYFTDTLWPDFREDDFFKALIDFQQRERRFGMTSEQITA